MIQTLVVAKSLQTAEEVSQGLKDLNMEVHIAENLGAAKVILANCPMDFLVVEPDDFNSKRLLDISRLRKSNEDYPILLIANSANLNDLNKIKKMRSTILLERPFSNSDLAGVSVKLLAREKVFQRIFRRYLVNLDASLESFKNGKTSPAHLLNLSKGGVFAESSGEFERGDIVFLDVALNEISRKHRLNARIVWVSPSQNGNKQLGINFIPQEEIYRELLHKM